MTKNLTQILDVSLLCLKNDHDLRSHSGHQSLISGTWQVYPFTISGMVFTILDMTDTVADIGFRVGFWTSNSENWNLTTLESQINGRGTYINFGDFWVNFKLENGIH